MFHNLVFYVSEKDVLSGAAGPGNASSWAGWAVSGMSSLTSRLVRPRGSADAQSTRTGPAAPKGTFHIDG